MKRRSVSTIVQIDMRLKRCSLSTMDGHTSEEMFSFKLGTGWKIRSCQRGSAAVRLSSQL